MLNRHRIETVLDVSLIGQREEADQDVVQPTVVDTQPDAVDVARLLTEAGLFDSVNLQDL